MWEFGDLSLCKRRVHSSRPSAGCLGTLSDAVCETWTFLRQLLSTPHLKAVELDVTTLTPTLRC